MRTKPCHAVFRRLQTEDDSEDEGNTHTLSKTALLKKHQQVDFDIVRARFAFV